MKIMMTGGSGLLGRQLRKDNPSIYAPSHEDMDILSQSDCARRISDYRPDVLIHAAAFTSPPKCHERPSLAREVNIRGTINLVNICEDMGVKLVYISTDYVFDGKKGHYDVSDPINPVNKYAETKAAGELATRTMDNSLVIRTSFCDNIFPYPKAFVDHYTSRDYVDIIAPLIYKTATSDKLGIAHVGTERKSVYDLAKKRQPEIGQLSISEVGFNIPADTSFAT